MKTLIGVSLWEDPSTLVLVAVIAVFGFMIFFSSKRRKAMQEQVEKMLDELRPGARVRTVGGVIGRIKEIREEGPGVKTVLLQTGSEKYPAYALFDIQAIYGVIAEEGHTLQGTPIAANVTAQTLDKEEKTVLDGKEIEEKTNFNAKEYVEKRNKVASKNNKK